MQSRPTNFQCRETSQKEVVPADYFFLKYSFRYQWCLESLGMSFILLLLFSSVLTSTNALLYFKNFWIIAVTKVFRMLILYGVNIFLGTNPIQSVWECNPKKAFLVFVVRRFRDRIDLWIWQAYLDIHNFALMVRAECLVWVTLSNQHSVLCLEYFCYLWCMWLSFFVFCFWGQFGQSVFDNPVVNLLDMSLIQ